MASEWFALIDGDEVGPLTDGELREYAAKGKLQPFGSVRKGQHSEWALAKNIRGLFPSHQSETRSHVVTPVARPVGSGNSTVTVGRAAISADAGNKFDSESSLVPAAPTKWKLLVAAALAIAIMAAATAGVMIALRPPAKTPFQIQIDEFIAESQRMIQMLERKTRSELLAAQLTKIEPELLDLVPITEQDRKNQSLAENLYQSLDAQRAFWALLMSNPRATDADKNKRMQQYLTVRDRTGDLFFQLTGSRLFEDTTTTLE